jgi:peptide/nickel transport system permease protein
MVESRERSGARPALVRGRGARAARATLLALFALALCAPLIANDLPYALRALDRGSYERARRELARVVDHAGERLATGEARALALECAAALERCARVRRELAPGQPAPEGELERLELALRSAPARLGEDAEQRARAAADLRLQGERAQAALEQGPAQLRARVRWPLFSALHPLEAAALAALAGALGATAFAALRRVWTRTSGPPRRARRGPRGLALACALCALLAGAGSYVAGASGGPPLAFKAAVQSGELELHWAVLPPLPFGWRETNAGEGLRPPTWTEAARMREDGTYERDAVMSGDSAFADFRPVGEPVRVLAFEPALNSAWRHPFGTDALGRDLLARCLWGARVSLLVALAAAGLATTLGALLGVAAGACGGKLDLALSRAIELVQCFPALLLILIVVAFADPRVVPPLVTIAAVVALVRWTFVARLARAELLRLREADFVLAARALGYSPARVWLRHALPHALPALLVAFAFELAAALLTESALSFLGFGIEHPFPSWGALLADSRNPEHWWIQLFPGALIFLVILCANVLAESARTGLDPRALPAGGAP